MQLIDASDGGTIGLDRVANIVIPANDDPYGSVAFVQSIYRVHEPLERSSYANITVRRRYLSWLLCLWECWSGKDPAVTKKLHSYFLHCNMPYIIMLVGLCVLIDLIIFIRSTVNEIEIVFTPFAF